MSKKYFDLSTLNLSQDGRVENKNQEMEELNTEYIDQISGGVAAEDKNPSDCSNIFCGDDTNSTSCTNYITCHDTTNKKCNNVGFC